jgi:hypothetical protein
MLAFLLALVLFASPVYAGEFALGPSGQERMLASAYLMPDAGWSIASYDASNCLQVAYGANYGAWADDIACSSEAASLVYAKGVWLTALRVVVTTALADDSTGACEFRLTTSNGGSAISGALLNAGPGDSTAMAVGTVYEVSFPPYRLAAGSSFEVEVRNGDRCGDSGSCACETFGNQQISVWGRY